MAFAISTGSNNLVNTNMLGGISIFTASMIADEVSAGFLGPHGQFSYASLNTANHGAAPSQGNTQLSGAFQGASSSVMQALNFLYNVAGSGDLASGSVGSTEIAAGAITQGKLASQSVYGANIVSGTLTHHQFGTGSVQAAALGANAVITAKILDANVTLAKIVDAAANTVLVRDADDAGVLSAKAVTTTQILIGDGDGFTAAALSGDVTMTNAGVVTIEANAVESGMILSGAVTSVKIGDQQVINRNMGTGSVEAAALGADAVITAKILDSNVTLAKVADAAANTVLVRDADDAGVLTAKAVTTTQLLIGNGTGFTAAALSGDVTMTNAGVVTIGSDKVIAGMILSGSVTRAKVALNAIGQDQLISQSVVPQHLHSSVAGNGIAVGYTAGADFGLSVSGTVGGVLRFGHDAGTGRGQLEVSGSSEHGQGRYFSLNVEGGILTITDVGPS